MAAHLAPIFVNDERVQLQGDARPQVARILEACGKQPADDWQVVQLKMPGGEQQQRLGPQDFIDRTQHADQGVYLVTTPRTPTGTAEPGTRPKASKTPPNSP